MGQQAQRWVDKWCKSNDPTDPGSFLVGEGASDDLNLPSGNDIVEDWMGLGCCPRTFQDSMFADKLGKRRKSMKPERPGC